jgi:hypothetical protein
MGSCAWLATQLDTRFVGEPRIANGTTSLASLPPRRGTDVSIELGGRPFIRYVTVANSGENSRASETFVSPTSYSPEDASSWLALPSPLKLRKFAVLIDPAKVDWVKGPRWCSLGSGIEYILPDGYTAAAVLDPGWAVKVR